MITCYVKYTINPSKIDEFEQYAKMWIPIVNKFGGTHNGYFLPAEGANNIALALFTFRSLTKYEQFRQVSLDDDGCKVALRFAEDTQCIVSYERSFFRPVF